MTNLSVDEIGERYLLNHAIVVQVQAAWQAIVCGTMCLQAACIAYITRLSWSHSAIYSTLINTALDLLGVGSTIGGRAFPVAASQIWNSLPVEFYLYPTVGTVLIHSVKPELTE